MERKSSKECSVVFLGKQKVQVTSSLLSIPCCKLGLHNAWVRSISQRSRSQIEQSCCLLVFSVHNHGFCGGPTHFPKKSTRAYRNKHSNLRNSRNIESSRSTSLEFAAFGNGSDIKHGRASAYRCLPQSFRGLRSKRERLRTIGFVGLTTLC